MKKLDVLKRSVVGVCAATLLTGLCAAPAFAAATDLTDGEINTEISIDTVAAGQISVTLPTSGIAGVVDKAGSLTLGEYTITNNSILDLTVNNFTFAKDQAASFFSLVSESEFTTSVTSNALTLSAAVGSETPVDLSAGGATSSTAKVTKDSSVAIKVTGSMKNFTQAGITSAPTRIGDFVITVGAV